MDLSTFKQDIDELLKEFAEGELKTVADMKRVWLGRKFSYIFEARPSNNLALFMQSLYNHSISYLDTTKSLSHKLGGLYCLYFLYETQPFKPPFKIYLSLGDLQRLKALVVNAKENGIKVVSVLVKRMLEKNAFLFGFVNINEYSEKERIKELVDAQNACIQKMHEKLLANTEIEQFLHMDMGMELDLKVLQNMSTEYEATKSLAVREASQLVDVKNIKHIAEDRPTIGDEVQKITEEWSNQKDMYSQQTGLNQRSVVPVPERGDSKRSTEQQLGNDDEQQDGGFLKLLLGIDSPEANGNGEHILTDQHSVPPEGDDQQDDEFDYAKELENQLYEDIPSDWDL